MAKAEREMVACLLGVEKVYQDGKIGVNALRGVNMEIPEGRFTMVVGPSGSGKSTLLNILGCIDKPTSGSIRVMGVDVTKLGDRRLTKFRSDNIGFIFQNFNLYPVLSAYENIEYPLLLRGEGGKKCRDKVLSMLEAVGLKDQANQRPNQLSGGQRQRVAIGRALVHQPKMVLADEPTANLDSKASAIVVDLMRTMQREHKITFVFSTHDPGLLQHSQKTFVINDGFAVEKT